MAVRSRSYGTTGLQAGSNERKLAITDAPAQRVRKPA